MNGNTFKPLIKLTNVFLAGNICIQENFSGSNQIEYLQDTVNDKCKFDELEAILKTTEKLTTSNVYLESELKTCNKAYTELITERNNCSQSFAFNRQMHENLKYQCTSETMQLRDSLQNKLKENYELGGKLQEKESEVATLKSKLNNFASLGFEV